MAITGDDIVYTIKADTSELLKDVETALKKVKKAIEDTRKERIIEIQVDIAKLQASLQSALEDVRKFKKEGDREGEINARFDAEGIRTSISTARKEVRKILDDIENGDRRAMELAQKQAEQQAKQAQRIADAKIRENQRAETQAKQTADKLIRENQRTVNQILKDAQKRETEAKRVADKVIRENERIEAQAIRQSQRIEAQAVKQAQRQEAEAKKTADRIIKENQRAEEKAKKGLLGLTAVGGDLIRLFTAREVFNFFRQIGRDVVNASLDFETGFTGVIKTMNTTDEQLNILRRDFIQLSKEMPIAIQEILRIGEIAGQLGIPTEQVAKFTDTISRIAVTTNVTANDAAMSFARIASVVGLPSDQIDRLGATVVDLGNNFATTEGEILDFANRITGAGAVVGASASDMVAIGTAFTAVGVQAEAGGTAVQKTFFALNEAVSQGGESLEGFSSFLRMTQEDFKNLFRDNPTEIIVRFVEALNMAGEDASRILGELVTKDVRLQRAFLSMAAGGDLLRDAVSRANTAFEENTALVRESELRFGTLASQSQQASNTLFLVAKAIGDGITPALIGLKTFFANFLSDLFLGTNNLHGFAQAATIAGVAITARFALGILKLTSGGLTKFISMLVASKAITEDFGKALTFSAGSGSKFSQSIRSIGIIFGSFLSPVNLAITALTVFIGVAVDAHQKAQQLRESVSRMNDSFVQMGQSTGRAGTTKIVEDFSKLQGIFKRAREDMLGVEGIIRRINEVDAMDIGISGIEQARIQFGQTADIAQQTQLHWIETQKLMAMSTEELAGTLGLTAGQLKSIIPNFDAWITGSLETQEEIEEVENSFVRLADKSGEAFVRQEKSFTLWKDAGIDAVEAFEKSFTDSMKYMTETEMVNFRKSVLEEMYNAADDFHDVGELFAIETANGLTASEVVRNLENAGLTVSEEIIGAFLRQSTEANDAGATYGLLLALGIESTEAKNATTAEQLRDIVYRALTDRNATQAAAQQAYSNASSIMANLINAILGKLPGLQSAVNSVVSTINKLSLGGGSGGIFSNIISDTKKLLTGGYSVQNALDTFTQDVKSYTSSAPKGGGGGGGGGGGKDPAKEAEKEAEKLAKEQEKERQEREKAEKELEERILEHRKEMQDTFLKIRENRRQREIAGELAFIDEYEESIKELDKNIETLTKNIGEYFNDIEKGINDTIKAQINLTRAFEAQSNEMRNDLVSDLANRMFELEQARQALIDENTANWNNPKEYERVNKNRETIIELEKEMEKIRSMNSQLTAKEIADYNEILRLEKQRSQLSTGELIWFDYARGLEQATRAYEEAYAQQQRFIDAQERIRDAFKGNTEEDTGFLKAIEALSGLDLRTQGEEMKRQLEELGISDLTWEQIEELLNMVTTARQLQAEKDAIIAQQKELADVRYQYMEAVEKAFFLSIERQKTEVSGMIALINQAISRMRLLNEMTSNLDNNTSSSNTVINQTNNINNGVDLEIAMNTLTRITK